MSDKSILLLGVTGGVGRAVADRLIEHGYELIVTCRTPAQRDALLAEQRYKAVVLLSLSDNASIDRAFDELAELGIDSLAGVINCAAKLHATPLEIVSAEEVNDIFQINVFGTLHTAQRATPLLRKVKGRIIFVGSLAGSFVMPMTGAYSASKFALEGICDGLRRELYPWGIHTSLIKPGAINTRMFQDHLADVTREKEQLEGEFVGYYRGLYEAHERSIPKTVKLAVSTANVARDVMRALHDKNPSSRYYPGIDSKITGKLVGVIPDRLQDWFSKKAFPL